MEDFPISYDNAMFFREVMDKIDFTRFMEIMEAEMEGRLAIAVKPTGNFAEDAKKFKQQIEEAMYWCIVLSFFPGDHEYRFDKNRWDDLAEKVKESNFERWGV